MLKFSGLSCNQNFQTFHINFYKFMEFVHYYFAIVNINDSFCMVAINFVPFINYKLAAI